MANVTFPRDTTRDIDNTKVVKPARLYGYTNNNIITTTYYCWRNETYSNSIYTLTAQPIESEDDLYIKNSTTGDFEPASANVIESVAEDYSYINDSQLGARSKHDRYSEGDETVSSGDSPLILYTDSTTLTIGMTLYDNTGTDTAYKIGTIISSTSFELASIVVKAKTSGATSWYLDSNGDLYGCGDNTNGQQGISSDTTTVGIFTKRASNVKDFDCSPTTTWYITNDNKLYGCGKNDAGQQGDGATSDVTSFTLRASNVRYVLALASDTWYITTDDKLYGCGANNTGCQGSGNTTAVLTFTQRASNVAQVKGDSGSVTWYLTNDGLLYGCGTNVQGNHGDGTGGTTPNNVLTFTQRASNVIDFDCTGQETWYVNSNGDLYGCGRNNAGQQGIDSSTARVVYFTQRASGVAKVRCYIASTWYLTTDGKLYGCGTNTYGQQGAGTTTNVTTFTQRATDVKDFAPTQRTSWYLTTDNRLFSCGINSDGQQGTSDVSNYVTTFTQRGTNVKNWVSDAAVYGVINYRYTTCYINNSGELYLCGNNYFGQQGDGTTTNITAFTKRAG